MLLLISSLLFLVVLNAEETPPANEGPCPVIPVVENFDITQFYQQKWYSLYHNFKDGLKFFDNKKCIEKHVTYDPKAGSFVFEVYSICEITNKPIWNKYYAYTTSTPGRIKWVYENTTKSESHPLYDTIESHIVDTDHKTYSVGYTCGYCQKTNKHSITVGVCSSTKELTSPDKLKSTVQLFKTHNVDINLVPVDWRDCRARCG